MKTYILGLTAAIIAGVGVEQVWIIGYQNARLELSLRQIASRSGNPGLESVEQFQSKDLPQLLNALSQRETLFEKAYLWAYLKLPEPFGSYLPDVYPSAMIRVNAAALTGLWGGAAKAAVPRLTRLLTDPYADSNAALSPGLIGRDARAAIPALTIALKERRPFAATALGKIGAAAAGARPALQAASQNGPDWLRRESLLALRRINEDLRRIDRVKGSPPSAP